MAKAAKAKSSAVSTQAWTQGPWISITDEDDWDNVAITTKERVTNSRIYIASVGIGYSGYIDAEQRANARLIASAPDLYTALHAVTDAYWSVADDHAGDGGEPPSCIAQARAALSKALNDAA